MARYPHIGWCGRSGGLNFCIKALMLFFLLFQDANLLECLPLSYSQAEYDDKDMKYELATLNVHNNSCQMLGCSTPLS